MQEKSAVPTKPVNERQFWDSEWSGRGARSVYTALIAGKVNGESVLNVGCGDESVDEVPRMAKRYVGLDPSLVALKMAKERHKGSDFVCAVAEYLPFRDDAFDKCIIVETATLLPRTLPDALREAGRIASKEVAFEVTHSEYDMVDKTPVKRLDYGLMFMHNSLEALCLSEDDVAELLDMSGLRRKSVSVLTCEEWDREGMKIYYGSDKNYERSPFAEVKAAMLIRAKRKE